MSSSSLCECETHPTARLVFVRFVACNHSNGSFDKGTEKNPASKRKWKKKTQKLPKLILSCVALPDCGQWPGGPKLLLGGEESCSWSRSHSLGSVESETEPAHLVLDESDEQNCPDFQIHQSSPPDTINCLTAGVTCWRALGIEIRWVKIVAKPSLVFQGGR